MMEIPESYTVARQLNEMVRGKKIEQVQAGKTPHRFAFYFGDPQGYPDLLQGRRIDRAEAIAGQLEIYIEEMRLVLSDGVNLRCLEPGSKIPARHQLMLELTDGSALVCTVQMYGGLHAFFGGENDSEYYHAAKDKPSPLTDAFDRAYFDGLWEECKPSASVKAFLATEQRIPGLGNGVLQDILFEACVNPRSRLEKLAEEDREQLFQSVKNTLRNMAEGGGRDTEKDLFGRPGGYAAILSKKTLAQPCPSCGGPIVREAFLGGNVYCCPTCQPVKK